MKRRHRNRLQGLVCRMSRVLGSSSAMTSLARIRLPLVCIVAVSGASIAWWLHKRNAVKKVSDAASLSRVRKAAEQGDAKAQFDLGVMYYKGRGLPQEYTEAARWYRKAADQGDAMAQQTLGYMHYNGQGLPQDYTEAIRWYKKAAAQGDAVAQQSLGYMYSQGQGVSQDYTEANRWY